MRKGLSTRRPVIRYAAAVAVAIVAHLGAAGVAAQSGAANGEWGVFGADAGATRFSPLDQIHAGNVGDLEVAWRWSARDQGTPPPSGRMQISPLVINGVLYTTAGNHRAVVALDAATGEPIWNWRPGDAERRWGDIIEPVARSAGRGVSYWTDGAGATQPHEMLRTEKIAELTPDSHIKDFLRINKMVLEKLQKAIACFHARCLVYTQLKKL